MLARPWSAIVRVPTPEGDAWFKENAPASAYEPALTTLLADIRPEALPETIAWEGPRIEFMQVVDEALALGTPDDRPELLPDRYAHLGGPHLDDVSVAADRLAGSLPLTVAHMEAH